MYVSRFFGQGRVYTVRSQTAGSDDADNDNAVYMTMYDATGNTCLQTRLDSDEDDFELNA